MISQKIIDKTKGIDEVTSEDEIMLKSMENFKIPSLPECQELFKVHGECHHYHKKWIRSYATTSKIETCIVCASTFGKRYFTQAEAIADEINDLLDQGISNKSEIYKSVVDKLKVPRPTVRRVANALRLELVEKVKILTSYDGEGSS